jgi:hypothetical protein
MHDLGKGGAIITAEHRAYHCSLARCILFRVVKSSIIQGVISIAATPCCCTTQSPAGLASRGARHPIKGASRLMRGSTRSSRSRSRVLCVSVPKMLLLDCTSRSWLHLRHEYARQTG